jgi:UDP-N-acetylglucosamine 2-epimerase (non-hydrolysing)
LPDPDFSFAHHFAGQKKHNTLAASFIKICSAAEELFSKHRFEFVVVQGDTTTASALAQTAFYNNIRVAHVEAGLRTFDLNNPFPEEANRSIIGQIASVNFAPTPAAQSNLVKAGARNIHLVGNTIVDAVNTIKRDRHIESNLESNDVLITLHRRENHGIMDKIFDELNRVALSQPEFRFTLPIHPNPNVKKHQQRLDAKNIQIINPVGYVDMLRMIAGSRFVITDSGGIQEECSCFNKKVLIVRETTERPEIIEIGLGKLVGENIFDNIIWASSTNQKKLTSPFGDGLASIKIAEVLEKGS